MHYTKINLYLALLIPSALITGPAIPDIIISLIAFVFLIFNYNNSELFFKKYKYFSIAFIVIWLYLLLNSILSYNPVLSFERSLPFIRFYFFTLALNQILNNERNFKLIIIFSLIPILFVCLDLFYQFIFLVDIFGFEAQHGNTRFQGPFDDELIAGSFLSKISLIPMALMFMKKNFFRYWFSFLIIFSVLITGERMSLIIITFSFLVFLILYDLKKGLIFSVLIFLSLSLFAIKNENSIVYRLNDFVERVGFNYLIGKSDKSFLDYGHGAHFLTAYEIFKDYPVFGSGLKTFREVCDLEIYENIPSKEKNVRCTTHPHNYYLEILSETGFFGFTLFIFSIFILIKNTFSAYGTSLNKISLYALLIYLFPIAATNSFFTNWFAIIFFFILSFNRINNN